MDAAAALAPCGEPRRGRSGTNRAADSPGSSLHTAMRSLSAKRRPRARGRRRQARDAAPARKSTERHIKRQTTMWSKLALVGTAAAFVGPRPTRLAPCEQPLDKPASRSPRTSRSSSRRRSATWTSTAPRPSLEEPGRFEGQPGARAHRRRRDLLRLLFAGVYRAVVFALGWFAARPSTDACRGRRTRTARASRRRCRARRRRLGGHAPHVQDLFHPDGHRRAHLRGRHLGRARGQVVLGHEADALRFRFAVRRRRVAQVAQPLRSRPPSRYLDNNNYTFLGRQPSFRAMNGVAAMVRNVRGMPVSATVSA